MRACGEAGTRYPRRSRGTALRKPFIVEGVLLPCAACLPGKRCSLTEVCVHTGLGPWAWMQQATTRAAAAAS